MRLKKILVVALAILGTMITGASAGKQYSATLNGAGATFPYPIYAQWAHEYNSITGVKINYQSIGSGGGIAQIKAKTVHFGASDAPMKTDELNQFGLIQFPMVIGGVVPVLNVSGITSGQLRLTSQILSDIFMGKVTKWNDPAIRKINNSLNLPNKAITVVHRADGSGTTWIFTNYLSKISDEWKSKVGNGKAVKWPTGVGGKGNEGVANYVKRISGAIGYVEYAYAIQNKMTCALLQNRDGNYVGPTSETFQAAAANADWKNAPGYYIVLTDQPGKASWPITGASFILIYKNQDSGELAKALLEYFDWCYKHGQEMALKLRYVPIPQNVVDLVENTWSNEVRAKGQSIWP